MDTPTLPPPTRDRETAWRHLLDHGVARLEGALPPRVVDQALRRLREQAQAERDTGRAWRDGGPDGLMDGSTGPNQRVWSLVNKGEVFRDILLRDGPLDLVRRRFRKTFEDHGGISTRDVGDALLSSFTANIAAPGGGAMAVHSDQMYAPLDTGYPLVANVMWMLDDFTEANGATRVVPGSHRFDDPVGYIRAGGPTVAAEGAAGTALIFDGRILHGTGANRSTTRRHGLLAYFCQPFVRQQENFMLSLDPDVRARAPEALLALLGFRCWNTLGMVEGTPHRRLASERDRIGELAPPRSPERHVGAG